MQRPPEPDNIPDVMSLHTILISRYPLSLHYHLPLALMIDDQKKYINLHGTVIYAYVIPKLHLFFCFFN